MTNLSFIECESLYVLEDGSILQPGQSRVLAHAATCSPAASRWRMTAMTWRLAAAFCS
jgi:hypothetical protein